MALCLTRHETEVRKNTSSGTKQPRVFEGYTGLVYNVHDVSHVSTLSRVREEKNRNIVHIVHIAHKERLKPIHLEVVTPQEAYPLPNRGFFVSCGT